MAIFPDDLPFPVHAVAADILHLETLGQGQFRATGGARNHSGNVFGGRMLAQSMAAAITTVPDMPVTSMHAYFLAAGQADAPLDYSVTTLRDSRRFANRRVEARQGNAIIFTLMAQFHAVEAGFAHQQVSMPEVPPPEAVTPLQTYVRENAARIDVSAVRNFRGATPVEIRPVDPDSYFLWRGHAARNFWFRLPGAGDIRDIRLHQCLLAYATDYWLAGVAAIPHAFPTNGQALLISSLDHALWFHRPVRCDQWLLHHTTSPSAGDGLGFAQGRIFDREGRLVASSAQECLLRRLVPPKLESLNPEIIRQPDSSET